MKPLMTQPFSNLQQMLSELKRSTPLNKDGVPGHDSSRPSSGKGTQGHQEERLFLQAMRGVIPLDSAKINKAPGPYPKKRPVSSHEDEQALVLKELKAIIEGKRPIPVHNTPEYVEWTWRGSNNPRLAKRLHHGDFAVQAYCELHGMDSVEALTACESFFAQALAEGKRCIALIHGRGLSSPGRPVLKETITRWLIRGSYRRFVLSFSSAPIWDGGAGVTYVLLKRHPMKHIPEKKAKKKW